MDPYIFPIYKLGTISEGISACYHCLDRRKKLSPIPKHGDNQKLPVQRKEVARRRNEGIGNTDFKADPPPDRKGQTIGGLA